MKTKLLLIFIVPFLLISMVTAAKTEQTVKTEETPDFQIMLLYLQQNNQLNIQHYNGDIESTEIIYLPNVKQMFGIDLSYKGYGASYSMSMKNAAKDEDVYGKSTYRDLQFYYFSEQWGADFYYQQYSGYYLDSPETDPVEMRPDLKVQTAGFNWYYSFNDKFELNHVLKNSSTKHGLQWAFLIMVSPNYFSVKGDESLILASEEVNFGDDKGFREGEYYSLSVAPGVGLTVGKNLFFTCLIFGGIGGMQKHSVTDAGGSDEFGPCIKANVKFIAGYDITTFFAGLSGYGDGTSIRDFNDEVDTDVMTMAIKVELFAGIRF